MAVQGGMGLVAGAAVEVTRQMVSLEAAQRLCGSMLAIPSPGGSFFQAAIQMELAALPSVQQSMARVQRLFEVSSHAMSREACKEQVTWCNA